MAEDRREEPGEASGKDTRIARSDRRCHSAGQGSRGQPVEFTPGTLDSLIGELKEAIAAEPEPSETELKKQRCQQKKQIKELEKHRDKRSEYDGQLKQICERNSMSKTDPDATFTRMKEDAMNNGQNKPGFNLQISSENQFITDFALFPNPTDSLTLIPFLNSFLNRYGHLPDTAVADSGYGSEDYYVCPMGQHMTRIGTSHSKTASGYRSENARYQALNCNGCPLRCLCYKLKATGTSSKSTIDLMNTNEGLVIFLPRKKDLNTEGDDVSNLRLSSGR